MNINNLVILTFLSMLALGLIFVALSLSPPRAEVTQEQVEMELYFMCLKTHGAEDPRCTLFLPK